jgi:hypothetical protein
LPIPAFNLYTTGFPIHPGRSLANAKGPQVALPFAMNTGEYMGNVRLTAAGLAIVLLFFLLPIVSCGSSHPGSPLFPGTITLAPSSTISLTQGGVLGFTAVVQTPDKTMLNTPVTFASSDTSILNLAANGVACAGHWDATFTVCAPGASGAVTVTASALGATSVPAYVFVHPPIDNIAVVGVLPNGIQVQEPCLSQSQAMTVEAHAYSKGNDITASVGPFTWSANNPAVVTITPVNGSAFNFATNQATAQANAPGITYIYASSNGVTSSSFQQPQLSNSQGIASPVLDFFATCPIQNISLELGAAGSGRTSFVVPKSGSPSETVIATVTDIMGNSSLPRTDGGLVLKIPLVWTSSQSQAVDTGTSCQDSCALAIKSAGSATITASCSPPTCNLGFPTIPNAFLTDGAIDTNKISDCTNYFKALYPHLTDCLALIPVPVYASPVFIDPSRDPSAPPPDLSPMAAISGVVTGSTSTPTVFASSTGCQHTPPSACNTSAYSVSTTTSAGSSNQLPASPNSVLFDPTGTRVWMGSDYGAQIVNPSAFGSGNPPFTLLGSVTGTILASSLNGSLAVFSDIKHTPNQVYVVNAANTGSPTALSIPSASMAAFTPDGLKAYIVGGTGGTSLYIYSALQALQGPFTLTGPPKAIAFSPNAAFTFIAESGSRNLTAFANCTNPAVSPIVPANPIALTADPILMKVLPALHIDGADSLGHPIPDGIHILVLDSTGFDIVTAKITAPASGTLCPQGLIFTDYKGDPATQRIELGQGTLQPLNFFYSADNTQLYVVSSASSSIIVYSFINGTVSGGIQLQNNAKALSADMTTDGGTIVIAGSDGMLHEVSTALGGNDTAPISFPNIPNGLNPFCSFDPGGVPCTLNIVQAKP